MDVANGLLKRGSNVELPGTWLFRVDEADYHVCPSGRRRPPFCDLGGFRRLACLPLIVCDTYGSNTWVYIRMQGFSKANSRTFNITL